MEGIELSTATAVNLQRVANNNPPYGYMADSTILQYQVPHISKIYSYTEYKKYILS